MTNEEAIDYIEKWKTDYSVDAKDREVLSMAIKALEQQPCDDCVSRDALRNLKISVPIAPVFIDDNHIKYRDAVFYDDIIDLPSVTPKYTDEEIDKAQLVEQAYVDKMVELAVEELKTPKAEWKDIYAESEGSNSWIEFTCPHCGKAFGIESGQYGWSYGDAIPWKACPMCGGLVEHEPYKAESEG